jgi:hypothetical protein
MPSWRICKKNEEKKNHIRKRSKEELFSTESQERLMCRAVNPFFPNCLKSTPVKRGKSYS